jgi:WD40 repeat protein
MFTGWLAVSVRGGLDGTLKLWELAKAAEAARFTGHVDFIGAVAFSPDGNRMVSGGHDKAAIVWEVQRAGRCRSCTRSCAPGQNINAG